MIEFGSVLVTANNTPQLLDRIPSVRPMYLYRKDAVRRAWWLGVPPLVYAAGLTFCFIGLGFYASGSIEAWWVPGCLGAGLILSELLFLPCRLAARERGEHAFLKARAQIAHKYGIAVNEVPTGDDL